MDTLAEKALLQSEGGSSLHILTRAAKAVERNVAREAKLLDLGCGKGEFLQNLRMLGWTAVHGCDGMEYKDAALEGIEFRKSDLNRNLPYESASFDAVTAIEVIEHLENPRAFVREIGRVLRPGGFLLLSTPNNESLTSLASLLFRGYYSAFAPACYPAHITPLLAIDLQRILRETEFTDTRFEWTNQGRIPASDLKWSAFLGPFARGKRFSDNVLVTAKRGKS